jgi:hypothetical protein
MIVDNFQGYMEGVDLTKVPLGNLAYPSKNVVSYKGKVSTRGGIVNDGVAATVQEPVHSEFVWKDALGGQRPMRVHGTTVQVKYSSKWYTIFTSLTAATPRVFFATWIDNNGSIVKKRLVMCDGSPNLYVWNGAIGIVASATTNSVVLNTTSTGAGLGFDAGNVTAQTILHFIGDATTANSEESQTNDPTSTTLSISGTFNTTPVAGDIIITKPVTFSNVISASFNIDVIYGFKNHVVVANYNSTSMYFSHMETYSLASGFNFTQPSAGSRTAITAIFMRLDGNFTAMIARKDILWISDANDWYKVSKSLSENAYGLWVDVEKFEVGESQGCLPMACANYKSEIVYVAQDSTIQKITSNRLLGIDEVLLVSNDIEALLLRLDLSDIRVNTSRRAIYFICPVDSTMLILDLVEGYFQPPQIMPINCMSVISGIKYGHHSAQNETFELFSGRDDLDTPIEAVIALGLWHGDHPLQYKMHTQWGISCRLTVDTVASVKQEFEENSAKTDTTEVIDGSTIVTYAINDDVSWGTHPYGDRAWGGADMEVAELRRAMVFSKFDAVSYFDWRPIITISGADNEFHLVAMWIDEQKSPRKVGNNLFISK